MHIYRKIIITSLIIVSAGSIALYIIKNLGVSTKHQPKVGTQRAESAANDLAKTIDTGFALAEQGKYDDAITAFKNALSNSLLTDEGNAVLVTAIGHAYFNKAYSNENESNHAQDWQKSIDYFTQALSMRKLPAKNRAFIHAKLGTMYLQGINDITPSEEKALEHLELSVSDQELPIIERVVALTNIGSIYHNRNQTDLDRQKALAYYQQATEIAKASEANNLLILLEKRIDSLRNQ